MKKTQKLKLTIEDITVETTLEKLPEQVRFLVPRLEAEPSFPSHDVVITSGGASLFVQIDFIGPRPKPKVKQTLFGYEQDELLAKQYK